MEDSPAMQPHQAGASRPTSETTNSTLSPHQGENEVQGQDQRAAVTDSNANETETAESLETKMYATIAKAASVASPSSSDRSKRGNFHTDYNFNSGSPSNSPALPASEPPTPTTGHVSVPLSVVSASGLSSPAVHVIPLQQTTLHNTIQGNVHVNRDLNEKIDSNTNSNVNSTVHSTTNTNMNISMVDVNDNATATSSITSFLPYRSVPKSTYNYPGSSHSYYNNSQFSITSSTRSVKSVGSSIIDTDYDNQSTVVPIPLAIAARNGITLDEDDGDVDDDRNVDVDVDVDDDDALSHGTNTDDDESQRMGQSTKHDGRVGAVVNNVTTSSYSAAMNNDVNNTYSNMNIDAASSHNIQMKFLAQFRQETLQAIRTLSTQQKRSANLLTSKLQNETNRRTALEGRLHAQLLLQAETMVAMEVKLLRLEAKVEKSSYRNQHQHQHGGQPQPHGGGGNWNSNNEERRRRHQQHQNLNQQLSNNHQQPQQLYLDHHINHHQRHGSVVGSIGANETIDEEEDSDSFGMDSNVRDADRERDGHGHGHNTSHGDGIVDREIEVKRRVTRSTTPPPTAGGNRNGNMRSSLLSTGGASSSRDGSHGQHHNRMIHHHHQHHAHTNPTNIAVISSGASLASGVTATSFLEETQGVEDQVVTTTTRRERNSRLEEDDDNGTAISRGDGSDGDVEDEGRRRNHGGDIMDGDGSTTSTPTQGGSRSLFRYADIQPVANLESILLNPIPASNEENGLGLGISTRAVRGHDYDGNSSLATSVTNTTIASTIVTATTRGNDSINIRSIGVSAGGGSSGGGGRDGQSVTIAIDGEDPAGSVSMSMGRSINEEEEEGVEVDLATGTATENGVGVGVGVTVDASGLEMNNSTEDGQYILSLEEQSQERGVNVNVNNVDEEGDHDRVPIRNESPLTVQSGSLSVGQSIASASVGTGSILSTAAVAPARSFRARREAAARMSGLGPTIMGGSSNMNMGLDGHRQWANRVVSFTSDQVFSVPPEISEGGDSITMPDELDNLSDVADEFATRARSWRDEYEARLDAIQKRWGGE